MVDLRNNFISDERLKSAQALLAAHAARARQPPQAALSTAAAAADDDAALWAASRVVSAVVHPDTGERVPAPFRMCAFMPVNLPITAGMLLSPPGGTAQLVWQAVNQSYNAGFNYANRNASSPTSPAQLAASYAVATGAAVGAAWGLGRVVKRLQAALPGGGGGPGAPPPPLRFRLLSRGLPWLAVATAGVANALAMRYDEGVTGVTVFDAPAGGAACGTSPAAGRAALAQVALTRVLLPVPILLLPPFVLDALARAPRLGPAMAASPRVRFGVELALIAGFLQGALPLALAVFPQVGAIPAGALEPAFHGRVDAAGRPVTTFYYNKGL